MLVADPAVSDETLNRALESATPDFDLFVIAHGLGPLWHDRTGRQEFHESRMSAEALYLGQRSALKESGDALAGEGIDYAVIKGAAVRESLYEKPALRTSYDIDILVYPDDKLQAAKTLVNIGFEPVPEVDSISREIVLSRHDADIDLHWGLLREGRLRFEDIEGMLGRRVNHHETWMPCAEDTLFLLLVHPAFAKHLAGWDMGLHRVVDIVRFLYEASFDWEAVRDRLWQNGVSSAAWATLRWTELLTTPQPLPMLEDMLADLRPGTLRCGWLDYWLRNNLSARLSDKNWLRLAGLSPFLHDELGDVMRALSGRRAARRRSEEDLALFDGLAKD